MRKTVFVFLAVLLTACSSPEAPPEPSPTLRRRRDSSASTVLVASQPRPEPRAKIRFTYTNQVGQPIRIMRSDYISLKFLYRRDAMIRMWIQVVDRSSGHLIVNWESFFVLQGGVEREVDLPIREEISIAKAECRAFEVRTVITDRWPLDQDEPSFVPSKLRFTATGPIDSNGLEGPLDQSQRFELQEF